MVAPNYRVSKVRFFDGLPIMNKSLTMKVLEADVETPNGYIFDINCLHRISTQSKKNEYSIVTFEDFDTPFCINNIIGNVTKIFVNKNSLYANITFCDGTKVAKIFHQLSKDSIKCELISELNGITGKKINPDNLIFIRLNIILKRDK